jgi:monofunctional biosynthetic peptidoglycan transglycosylase
MTSKSRIALKKAVFFVRHSLLLLFQLFLFLIILYRVAPVPLTPLMLIRTAKIEKDWIPLEKISTNVIKAAITSEDPKFISHWGYDISAIRESLENNLKKGKKLRGGSTISQQTAKNLFLWPDRSWIRKALEVPVTTTLELLWTKKRIMEVYLNIIEMGDGIYGIQAAARKYFDKDASRLSAAEASLIVVCFPNPRLWTPAKPTAYIRKKQSRILRWMQGFEPVPEWWYSGGKQEKLKKNHRHSSPKK